VPPRDYYNVLGVSRTASQDEIKKTYRKLARRWHPDLNPGREDVVERFRDITEAYDTLSDPEKRARYDRMGPLYTDDGRPPRPDEVSEVVGSMLGNLFRRKRPAKGEDLRFTLSVTLEEVAVGVEKEIVVPRKVRCRKCGGDGADGDDARVKCAPCNGTGSSQGPRLFRTTCYHCEGRGFTVSRVCSRCDGQGRVSVDEAIRVRVPAGVATGQKLRLAGRGDEARDAAEPGDLFVITSVAEHPLFRRRADDLLAEVPITFADAVVGSDIEVPTLEGTTRIRVPPGTTHGRIFRLSGRALPRLGSATRGDLHYQVAIEVPTGLDEAQRLALAAWGGALPDSTHPQRAEYARLLGARR
jgi:molecular chaperone DnaJ